MPVSWTVQILVDSSTKPSSKTSKYGESTACWAIYTSETTPTPEYVGMVYRQKEGPNRIFYIGVIHALEEILKAPFVQYRLKVRGDCQPVIDQLNEKWRAVEMKALYDQAKALEQKIRQEKRAQVEYEYLNEASGVYLRVDQCAKQFREFVKQRLF